MQPDTIVPGAANPQAWNRYSYVLNNPLKYTDPTGHYCVGDDEDCADEAGDGPAPTGTGGNNGGGGGGGGRHHDDVPDPNPSGFSPLEGLIRQEIDRRFDPFNGWLPAGFDYGASEYPTYDYYAEQAYGQAGYDVLQIASQNGDNPMTDADWLNSNVPIDYIYSKGIRGQPPGHKFFLNYMGRDINNPSNYEANYLNALMVTHSQQVKDAKNNYYAQLLSVHGSLQASWEYLEMNIGVNGPSD